jgi:hypothetical protein
MSAVSARQLVGVSRGPSRDGHVEPVHGVAGQHGID